MATAQRSKWLGGAALTAALVLFPVAGVGAATHDGDAWLSWRTKDGADACVAADAFEADVGRRLGENAANVARRAGVRLTVDLERASQDPPPMPPASAEMTFTTADGRSIGRRAFDLRGVSCGAAGEALSIAAALFLQGRPQGRPQVAPAVGQLDANGPTSPPDESSAPTTAATEAAPTEAAPATVAPVSPPPPPSVPPRADVRAQPDPPLEDHVAAKPARWTFGGSGGALIGIGDVPSGTWGLEATLLARPNGWPSLFLAGDFSPRQKTSSDIDVDISIQFVTGRAGICPIERQWTSRELSLCAAFELGRLSAEGSGLNSAFRQDRWKLAADAGVALTQVISGAWSARLETRLVAPFERDRIAIVDSTGRVYDLFRASPIGGAAVISLGYTSF